MTTAALTRVRHWILTAVVGMTAALVAWAGIRVIDHLLQDHRDHHLVLEFLQYNLQQGRLVPLPLGALAPGTPTGRQPTPPPSLDPVPAPAPVPKP